jgi:predicted TIM-barrel fold metal-dependent hydrolase
VRRSRSGRPRFADLVDLVRSGEAYVKNFRRLPVILAGADYPDVARLAKALIAANPQRVVWGSDWPHTNATTRRAAGSPTPLLPIDDGCLLNQLPLWAADAATRKAILVDSPARLYGF